MTPETFAIATLTVAIAILLLVELSVPFGGIRRWLLSGPHVETDDPVYGPWWVVDGDGARDGEAHATPQRAAAQLTAGQRVRAWGGEWISCPYCTGAWAAAAILGLLAVDRGTDVLWYWPAVWAAASMLVVTVRAIGER